MRRAFYLTLLLTICSLCKTSAEEARLLRFPTTNGHEVVFSFAGDLYKVPIAGGEARRLTSHVGYEMFPRFSPDGKSIAFTGQYDGNTEVFTIPAEGGEPLRLTYTATNQRDDLGDRMGPNNIVMCWTLDGSQIVYRNRKGSGFAGQLYRVSPEGGLSEVIPLPEGGFCSYSPDGKQLAYNRVMREFRTWKYYRGGMADDVWIYNPEKSSVENITKHDAQDIMPMWIGDEIYFISDRDRTMNVFVYHTQTKETTKVTSFTDYDVKFPSTNGTQIVFENAGYLYHLDPATKKSTKINVTLRSDERYARREIKEGKNYVSRASLSPDGERVVITARGELFNVPVKKGVTKNATRTPGVHERLAQWSPDGKWIAYIADGSGETELYLQPSEGGDATPLTKGNDSYILDFVWSPDAKNIVYTDRKNRVYLLDLASKGKKLLFQDSLGVPRALSFSPDSRWLTYTRTGENNMSIIFVYQLEQQQEYPVTDRWYASSSPVFSQDGKYLIFRSMRDLQPIYGALEWNHVYKHEAGLYLALLKRDTPSPFLEKDGEMSTPKSEEKTTKTNKHQTAIDPEGLTDRIVRIPISNGNYMRLASNENRIYYWRDGASYTFDLDKQKEAKVSDGAVMLCEPNRKKVLFSKGRNEFFVLDHPSGSVELKEAIDLSNMMITTDYSKEWEQIFYEAWRAFRDGFYLENMHGVDWDAMGAKYAVFLPFVKNRLDLNYIIGEMIGELNCGHAYVNPGEMDRPKRVKMGLLGAEVIRDRSGFFMLTKILPGESWSKALRSPLTEPGIEVKKGDFIVAIDGVPTNGVKDLYQLLVGKANVLTELSIHSRPQLEGAKKIVILPLEEEYSLYHHQWVKENIAKVDKASNGKIGYIYIPDMGREGLIEFSRYFYPQLDKEGLIIDDRANGGGNVSPMLLERLAREPYRLTTGRGTKRVGTIPNGSQVGPKVCLINKYSASDGDLFPWGFRALGLGKLIGTRTWGGIVGISGSLPFIDGTDLRVPFFTSYDIKSGEWIIENHGVDPDILIDNHPLKEWAGEDEQLNRAIEEVMKELTHRVALPPPPSPRIWNK